jgi:hydrogenase maturation factor
MFSVGAANRYVSSKGGSPGDRLIVTKGAAIAATGILARVFHNYIEKSTNQETAKKGSDCFRKITVIEDALVASSVGVKSAGVTAMHDATEGGVLSALYELATASSAGLYVEKEKIPVSMETRSICDLFHIDPLTSVGEGALVIACQPRYTPDVVSALEARAIPCAIVGELKQAELGFKLVDGKGMEAGIEYPVADPYWNAYYLAKKNGLN